MLGRRWEMGDGRWEMGDGERRRGEGGLRDHGTTDMMVFWTLWRGGDQLWLGWGNRMFKQLHMLAGARWGRGCWSSWAFGYCAWESSEFLLERRLVYVLHGMCA